MHLYLISTRMNAAWVWLFWSELPVWCGVGGCK